ncbi:ATP-binding protein (AAA domain) [Halarcobacter bivalviorum]|uniref:ATP-binding protein (AAA domain) n=2 Tax=Halarcobacter bivalviorum TaxID=663364 RepID=A0AB33GK01_9BACT|nr:ATP-binding protein (AAA domain) [Halarcobacter bivalviorum]
MDVFSKLIIKKLMLIGHRKNYEVPFFPGVNIIYGEEDCGKSSILELINYLLGASSLDKYDELEQSVKYAILELNLNNEIYCIKRDIFDAKKDIEVYMSSYENIDLVFPSKYKPKLDNTIDGKFFSDFLLDTLNYPKIKIKNAPTQDNSTLSRLSFRDLFKFCYINQDDVGSKNFLSNQYHPLYHKVKEVFKYIFNLSDEEISEINQLISEKSNLKNKLSTKISNIQEFLETIEIETLDFISTFLEDIKTNLKQIEEELQNINVSITSSSKEYAPLKEHIVTLNYQIKDKEKEKAKTRDNIKRYEKLINDYYDDRLKIEGVLSAKQLIGKISPDIAICPLCKHDVEHIKLKEEYSIHNEEKLGSEVKILNKRIKDLTGLIEKEKESFRNSEIELSKLIEEREQFKKSVDEELKEHISPYLTKRDELIKQQSTLIEKEQQITKALKIRNEENNLNKEVVKLDEDLKDLKEKLDELTSSQVQIDNVLNDLKLILETYLKSIDVKNRTGIGISEKTFLPILRNKQYNEITSGGVRTVLSMGFLLNILEYSLNNDINHPRLLMIDTVGKYLQKTKKEYLSDTDEKEDIKEEIRSAGKYKALYEYIINLSIKMEEANKSCQIILVDNDVPPFIEEEYKGFIIRRFSKDENDDLPIGLIDDYSEDMY